MLIEKTYYARGQTEKDEIVKSLEKEYGIPQYMATIKAYEITNADELMNGYWKIELTYSSLD
jgi:hypothetical protein